MGYESTRFLQMSDNTEIDEGIVKCVNMDAAVDYKKWIPSRPWRRAMTAVVFGSLVYLTYILYVAKIEADESENQMVSDLIAKDIDTLERVCRDNDKLQRMVAWLNEVNKMIRASATTDD
eukprot:GHVO01018084.1.p1 GENE.GHVO01018084.1~~GHVO01018084.1.p1  ORF type:complete len:120 (+),score=23.61 GHVO01018084.1:118-477(+)